MVETDYRSAQKTDGKQQTVEKLEEAHLLAQKEAQALVEKHSQVQLSLVPKPQVMTFFHGWRFSFDVFLGSFRVRRTVVILFVAKNGEVIEEWNDIDTVVDELRAISPSQETLPPIQEAIVKAREQHQNATVETVEAVWDPKEVKVAKEVTGKETFLRWRLGLRTGIERHVVTVCATDSGAKCCTSNLRSKYATAYRQRAKTQWRLGDNAIRLQSNGTITHLVVDFEKFGTPVNGGKSDHWVIWSCMARTAQFIRELEYGDIGLYSVIIEFDRDENPDARLASSEKGDLTVISFPSQGIWSEDITMIIHELGHAFWNLMFTRIPKPIDLDRFVQQSAGTPIEELQQYFVTALQGVQEGFSDFFAAAVVADNISKVQIGSHVARLLGADNPFGLPRLINGKPHLPVKVDNDPIGEHEIGWQWANFLWDVRQALVQQKVELQTVNRAIIDSHIQPRTSDDSPAEPLACYFHSLQRTLGTIGTNLDWKKLALRHAIHVEPLPRGKGLETF